LIIIFSYISPNNAIYQLILAFLKENFIKAILKFETENPILYLGKEFREKIMSITLSPQVTNAYIRNVLSSSTNSYQTCLEQLSSGTKFSSTGDDPIAATQTIDLDNQISATAQALSNAELGGNLLDMAEDAEVNVISELQRIRDLCVEAANGTYSDTDKDAILTEIKQRLSAIDDIADTTDFNGNKLLDGSSSSLVLQTGTSSSSTLAVGAALINVHVSQLGTGTNIDLRLDDTVTGSTWTTDDIGTYIDKIDSAITQMTNASSNTASYINSIDRITAGLTNMSSNLESNKSAIADTDVAQTSADMIKFQILQEASTSILVQANQMAQLTYGLLPSS
jgi:flagellin